MPRLIDLPPAPIRMFKPTATLLPSSDDAHVESNSLAAARTRRKRGVKLTETEIRKAVESHYPPVLTLDMAATISGYASSTLKRLLSEGRFKNSAKRKKPVLFWRDRFIQELMQG